MMLRFALIGCVFSARANNARVRTILGAVSVDFTVGLGTGGGGYNADVSESRRHMKMQKRVRLQATE